MNYIPLTAAQKQILRDRTLVLARIMERYLLCLNRSEDVHQAFNLLIDVEPDLDVALTYAHDRDHFASLTDDQRRTMIEDYRNLAYSPPDRPDKGAPNVTPRLRYAVSRMPLNSDPNDKRDVDLFEPLTPEDKIVSVAVDKRRDLYAKPPVTTTKPSMLSEWAPPLTHEQSQHIERIHGTIPDHELIQRIVLPSHSEPTPELPASGPAKPPHMLPPYKSDWSGAHVTVVGGDFNGAKGKVT